MPKFGHSNKISLQKNKTSIPMRTSGQRNKKTVKHNAQLLTPIVSISHPKYLFNYSFS